MYPFLTAFVVPSLLLLQIPFLQRGDQPDANQRVAMYSKSAVVRIMAGCTGTYNYDGVSYPFASASLGSGYFVDPNGYVVTNAHVVSFAQGGKDACRDRLFDNLVRRLTGENDLSNVSQDRKENIRANSRLENYTYANDVILPNGEALSFEVKEKGIPIVDEEQRDIGKDVAVIKIEVTNAPALKLGDSSKMQIQQPVMVLGYPGTADVTSILSDKSISEASVLNGLVANTSKIMKNGSPVLQLNVTVAPGSSGSPVLNQKGEVVGMITFGGNGWDEETSFPYAIPTSTILEFTRKSGAANDEGSTGPLYREGLDLFWQGDYEGAKRKFEAVQGLFPQHSEAAKLIKTCEQELARHWQSKTYVPLFIGIGIAAVGLLGAYFLVKRRSADLAGATSDVTIREGANWGRARANSTFVTKPFFQPKTIFSQPEQARMIASPQPFLKLENPGGQEKKFTLDGSSHRLGRDRTWADLKLPDEGWGVISKRHARFKKEGESYRIYDGDGVSSSTNRTLVNGIQIGEEGYLLQDGDQLQIGLDSHRVTGTYFHPIRERLASSSPHDNSRDHNG